MKLIHAIIVGLILVQVILPCVSAEPTLKPLPSGQTLRISADVGETYIRWVWKDESGGVIPPTTIYLDTDTNATKTNYALNYLFQSELGPNEKHEIRLYGDANATVLVGHATATTSTQWGVTYLLMILCVILMFATILLSGSRELSLMIGLFTIILSLVAVNIIKGHPEAPWILFGIAILTGAFLLMSVIKPMADEHLKWW